MRFLIFHNGGSTKANVVQYRSTDFIKISVFLIKRCSKSTRLFFKNRKSSPLKRTEHLWYIIEIVLHFIISMFKISLIFSNHCIMSHL